MQTLPLSMLIDQLEGDSGVRDRAFVRGLSHWMQERAPHLRIDVAERLELTDVVVTFQMKKSVKLVITGFPPEGLPGEVTLSVHELEFPHVNLFISEQPYPDPYEMCTLDYSHQGRTVRVTSGEHSGQCARLVVAATVGREQQNRVQLESGEVITLDGEVLKFVDEPTA